MLSKKQELRVPKGGSNYFVGRGFRLFLKLGDDSGYLIRGIVPEASPKCAAPEQWKVLLSTFAVNRRDEALDSVLLVLEDPLSTSMANPF
jgi:hypothetical protein